MRSQPRYVCADCDLVPGALSPCRHALAGSSPDGMRRLYSPKAFPLEPRSRRLEACATWRGRELDADSIVVEVGGVSVGLPVVADGGAAQG